jgi:hypothetical protein
VSSTALLDALGRETENYRLARRDGDDAAAWAALERAHILSQSLLGRHLRVHALMLSLAVARRDAREVVGQAARLALAPLGALTGRVPWGNSGRARVSPFAPAPIPADLAPLLEPAGAKAAPAAGMTEAGS